MASYNGNYCILPLLNHFKYSLISVLYVQPFPLTKVVFNVSFLYLKWKMI